MGNLRNSSFKTFLTEKKRGKKKSKRKHARGGGPAVGQGGMGGSVGRGESRKPKYTSLLHELHSSSYAFSNDALGYTQAATQHNTQPDMGTVSEPSEGNGPMCPDCGCRMMRRARYCHRCGTPHPIYQRSAPMWRTGYEEQEAEAEVEDVGPEPTDADDIDLDSESGEEMGGSEDSMEDPTEEPAEPQDPDKQGIIRTVDGAHLVYKRQGPAGDYEELWIYNVDTDLRNELEIRRNILAGTDIPVGKTKSDDGSQQYDLTTLGNAQLLHITGLPN